MTSVDLVLLAVMILSGLIAFVRGLVREVLSIVAWLGAAAVSFTFLPTIRPWISPYMPSPEWTDPAGYIILFLIALIVFSLIAKTIGGAVRSSPISGIDRTLGLVFGLARGAVLAIIVYIVACMAIPPERWPPSVLESRSLPYIYTGAAWIARRIPPEYQPAVPPPPSRQAALNGILTTSPTGRAIDPPLRR
ncbi:MAG: CvpA family protein [Acetobacteraceae bacterium]|jgi:membrane protein required for colicin V production